MPCLREVIVDFARLLSAGKHVKIQLPGFATVLSVVSVCSPVFRWACFLAVSGAHARWNMAHKTNIGIRHF